MRDKIIGWAIAGILTIAGITVTVTQEDVANQYKENTGKELSISNDELFSYREIIDSNNELIASFESDYDYYNCENYDFEIYGTCDEFRNSILDYINATKSSNICFENLDRNNVEKDTLEDCIEDMERLIEAESNYSYLYGGICDEFCEENIDAYEYNKALFQSYIKNLGK